MAKKSPSYYTLPNPPHILRLIDYVIVYSILGSICLYFYSLQSAIHEVPSIVLNLLYPETLSFNSPKSISPTETTVCAGLLVLLFVLLTIERRRIKINKQQSGKGELYLLIKSVILLILIYLIILDLSLLIMLIFSFTLFLIKSILSQKKLPKFKKMYSINIKKENYATQ